jgi:hypothetical protein
VIPISNQEGRQAKNKKKIKKKSPLKLLSQSQPNFTEMIFGWFPSKIMSDISDLRPILLSETICSIRTKF